MGFGIGIGFGIDFGFGFELGRRLLIQPLPRPQTVVPSHPSQPPPCPHYTPPRVVPVGLPYGALILCHKDSPIRVKLCGGESRYRGTICAFWRDLLCPTMDCGSWASEERSGIELTGLDTENSTSTEVVSLPSVDSSFSGHETQLWYRHNGPVQKAVLTARWNDQGWGNQKGQIQMRCDDGPWQRITTEVAPHCNAFLQIEIEPGCVSTLDLGYEVGGGGGHELYIENGRLEIQDTNVSDEPEFLPPLPALVVAQPSEVHSAETQAEVESCYENVCMGKNVAQSYSDMIALIGQNPTLACLQLLKVPSLMAMKQKSVSAEAVAWDEKYSDLHKQLFQACMGAMQKLDNDVHDNLV
mmetsp:Transcript_68884/g.192418  ORF Transcript_68884/g.192418 Transcript_68884/m.192418 type:complete len:355 (+) Transcript_68884:427-1491(+)